MKNNKIRHPEPFGARHSERSEESMRLEGKLREGSLRFFAEPTARCRMFRRPTAAWATGVASLLRMTGKKSKRKLILEYKSDLLSLLLLDKDKVIRFERILLREMPVTITQAKVQAFTAGEKLEETILVLGRSEVLQKELSIAPQKGSDPVGSDPIWFKEQLQEKISELLPYSPKQMAFGLSLEETEKSANGLLMALPERNLKEILTSLSSFSIFPTEIITEDQSLYWLCLEKGEKGNALVLHQQGNYFVAVCVSQEKLCFSRSFPFEEMEEIPEEISLLLLEKGIKPEKLLLSGSMEKIFMETLERHFRVPLEKLPGFEEDVPATLYGAKWAEKYSPLSLLPHTEKRLKKEKQIKTLFTDLIRGSLMLLGAFVLMFFLKGYWLSFEQGKLTKQIEGMRPEIQTLKEIEGKLEMVLSSQKSKENALKLLKDLSENVPSTVILRQIEMREGNFLFKGECSSHRVLSETVKALEALPGLKEIKLERTGLRKRLNEDYFDFEVSGKWQI